MPRISIRSIRRMGGFLTATGLLAAAVTIGWAQSPGSTYVPGVGYAPALPRPRPLPTIEPSESPPPAPPEPAFYAPPAWTYPGQQVPLSGPWISTAAHPYPPGYIIGPYSSLPFTNYNPRGPQDKGVIEVFVPVANARVYLNGQETRGGGTMRVFTTPPLRLSGEFQYYVTATYESQGHTISELRKVHVGAGEYNVADFNTPALDNPADMPSGPVDQNQVYPALSERYNWPQRTY